MDEVLAYTAQAQYLRGHGVGGDVPPSPPKTSSANPKVLAVFKLAFALGDAFLTKKKLDPDDGTTVDALKKAIMATGIYDRYDVNPLKAFGFGK